MFFSFENVKCKKYVICLEFTKETAAYLSLLLHFLKLEGYFLCPKAKQLDWNRLKDQLIKKVVLALVGSSLKKGTSQ